MCRLFGLSAGTERLHASFWLLDAPDSLQVQGRRNRDGTGLGFFDEEGQPIVDKQPEAAYADVEFITEAKTAASTTFVAHVRVATTGEPKAQNTHPFSLDGRIMAHNGGFEELPVLEEELGEHMGRVEGDTDSERYMALISKCVADNGGDVGAGITEAATWIAEHLPLFSLNLVLVAETEMWALRYPEHHRLYALRRREGGEVAGGRALHAESERLRVRSEALMAHPSVVVASEPMDEGSPWRLMESGELLHVAPDLTVTSTLILPDPPRRRSIDPLPYVP
jgi:predicted glutamine amidotransferase